MRGTSLCCTVLLLVAACGGSDDREVRVFAAASLTASFTELGELFEAEYPGTRVALNFAASSALAAQIEQGADADVFASADEVNMRRVERNVEDVSTLALNRLAIAVEDGNPKGIQDPSDLTDPGLLVVLCASQVPCGAFADVALTKAGVAVDVVSREEHVKAVLTKVELGEADAGVVYVTDVRASSNVEGIDIPDQHNVTAIYPIAVLADAPNPDGAAAFVELVTSARGARVLSEHGFEIP